LDSSAWHYHNPLGRSNTQSFTYDGLNRLTASSGLAASVDASYAYDRDGNRTSLTVNGAPPPLPTTAPPSCAAARIQVGPPLSPTTPTATWSAAPAPSTASRPIPTTWPID
jgi:hypothetical protein